MSDFQLLIQQYEQLTVIPLYSSLLIVLNPP
jgi:hypothetical protein